MNTAILPLSAKLFDTAAYEIHDDPHGSTLSDAGQLPQNALSASVAKKGERSNGSSEQRRKEGIAADDVGSPDCDVDATFPPEDDGEPAHEPDAGTVGAACSPGATLAPCSLPSPSPPAVPPAAKQPVVASESTLHTNTQQKAMDAGPLEIHPYADIFPLLHPSEFEDLLNSLKKDGQLNDITIYEGKILDGRNRYLACQKAGLEPRMTEYMGSDPVGFVSAQNVNRRHLTAGQRARHASQLATFKEGEFAGNQHSPASIEGGHPAGKSIKVAAKEMNVARSTVERMRRIEKHGIPALVAAVQAGTVSVGAAADIAKLPVYDQLEVLAKGPDVARAKAALIRNAPAGVTPAEKRAHEFDSPGRGIWRKARKLLSAIKPSDACFEEVMLEISEFCRKRLEDHAKKS